MSQRRSLDPASIQRRLRAIRDRLDQLGRLGPVTVDRLTNDWLVRAATERVLTQLVELAVHVNTHIVTASGMLPPVDYRQSFIAAADVGAIPADLAVKIAPSAGLRNILVHDYLDADLAIVADSVSQAIAHYTAYVQEVARWLEGQSGTS